MMSDSGSQWEFTLFYSGQNKSLRSINLSWNGFSDKGLKGDIFSVVQKFNPDGNRSIIQQNNKGGNCIFNKSLFS